MWLMVAMLIMDVYRVDLVLSGAVDDDIDFKIGDDDLDDFSLVWYRC